MEAEEKVWIGAQTIKHSDLFDLTVKALRILKSSGAFIQICSQSGVYHQ